jgi:signal transduction histidine kinase
MATATGNHEQTASAAIDSRTRRSGRPRLLLELVVATGGIALSLSLGWLLLARGRSWESAATLLGGLVITGLLVACLMLLSGRAARVEQLVAERTRELRENEERLRQLVAYEIHDGLAQQLTSALYKFQSVEQAYERDPGAAQKMFAEGVRLLREAMAECRRLISGLRPPVLDEAGIVAAINSLVAEQRQRGGPEIEFVHREEFERLAPPVEIAAFRIVQECLTNACRYSQSQKVRVELGRVNGRVRIEVQDWGIGFDPERIEGGHFGLEGIRQRARLLGGVATIQAAPKQGTHITVELPLLPRTENGTA